MTVYLILSKIACKKFMKAVKILPKIAQICDTIFFKFFFAILISDYTVSIKFVHAIWPKIRKTILDCKLNSILENCFKTLIVGFGWIDVLGFSSVFVIVIHIWF